jgi:N-acetylmuramoyl-L-alanine amidase
VSDKFRVKIAILKKKNKLSSDVVHVGDQLWVPVKAEYKVSSGETLDQIAAKYKCDAEAILKANSLKAAGDLKSGQTIYIPY